MYLDHPKISATNSETEPDRLERINRAYGYVVGLADIDGNGDTITKIGKLHDHKGTLLIIWRSAPTEQEKIYFMKAWQSKIGDESDRIEHALMLQEPTAAGE